MFISNKGLRLWAVISMTAAIAVHALADDSSNHLRVEKDSKKKQKKRKEKKAKDPASKNKNVLLKEKLSKKEVASVDRTKAALEDIESEAKGNPPRFAIPNKVSIDPHKGDGTWEVLDDGTQIWRYRMKTKGCNSLNFGFCEYHMPKGGQLFIYDTNGRTSISRPFTEEDNAGGVLWTPVIESCDVIIEVNLHTKVDPQDMKLQLCSANVGYRAFDTRPEDQHGMPRDSGHKAKGRQLSGDCHVDVVCDGSDEPEYAEIDNWRNEIPSVAAMAFGGWGFCTGTLINNLRNDKTPYFLTAQHCGVNWDNAESLITYWNFETSECGGIPDGSRLDFTTGATHLSDNLNTDMTLLRLNSSPEDFGVTYAGWDRRSSASFAREGVMIHHPAAHEKRISFEYHHTSVSGHLASYVLVTDWDLGSSEDGSSGAPLFDQDHRIIGQLWGGIAGCGIHANVYFGRFYSQWPRLAQWLDPDNTGLEYVDTLVVTGGSSTGTSSASIACTSSLDVHQTLIPKFNTAGVIRIGGYCFEAQDDKYIYARTCHSNKPAQQWVYDGTRIRSAQDPTQCIMGRGQDQQIQLHKCGSDESAIDDERFNFHVSDTGYTSLDNLYNRCLYKDSRGEGILISARWDKRCWGGHDPSWNLIEYSRGLPTAGFKLQSANDDVTPPTFSTFNKCFSGSMTSKKIDPLGNCDSSSWLLSLDPSDTNDKSFKLKFVADNGDSGNLWLALNSYDEYYLEVRRSIAAQFDIRNNFYNKWPGTGINLSNYRLKVWGQSQIGYCLGWKREIAGSDEVGVEGSVYEPIGFNFTAITPTSESPDTLPTGTLGDMPGSLVQGGNGDDVA